GRAWRPAQVTGASAYDRRLLCRPRPRRHLAPLSFPTRRSSDLDHQHAGDRATAEAARSGIGPAMDVDAAARGFRGAHVGTHRDRSEEHTSELQSREKLVCRPLLEKKKNLPGAGHVYRVEVRTQK